MKKYKIELPITFYVSVEVEAEDEYTAVEQLSDIVVEGQVFGKDAVIVKTGNIALLKDPDFDNLEITELWVSLRLKFP